MSVTTVKYIRKPLFVAAVRITGANFDEVADWCQGEVQQEEVSGKGSGKKFIRVRVHNPKNPRQTKGFVGDWLLYTERGYKVYTNKAFRASFDEATEENSGNGKLVEGSEEVAPGLSLNRAVALLKKQPELTLEQIRELVKREEAQEVE